MDRNQQWYPNQQQQYYQQPSQQYHDPRAARAPAAAADAVQDAHGLLSVYPLASATPTTHVARHLSNMAVTVPPPSYSHPSYYSLQHAGYSNPPSTYTEYSQELTYLSTAPNDSAYWESTRNEVVGLIGNQAGNNSMYAQNSMQNSMSSRPQLPSAPSVNNWEPSPFAQSIMNRVLPPISLPRMSSSSSSLAMALGPPPSINNSVPQQSPPQFNQPQYTLPPLRQPTQGPVAHPAQSMRPPQQSLYSHASLPPRPPQAQTQQYVGPSVPYAQSPQWSQQPQPISPATRPPAQLQQPVPSQHQFRFQHTFHSQSQFYPQPQTHSPQPRAQPPPPPQTQPRMPVHQPVQVQKREQSIPSNQQRAMMQGVPQPPVQQSFLQLKRMKVDEAPVFFNNFLEQKTREMNLLEQPKPHIPIPLEDAKPRTITPTVSVTPKVIVTQDGLAGDSNMFAVVLEPTEQGKPREQATTPRKRKLSPMESPSIKRIRSLKSQDTLTHNVFPSTPDQLQVPNGTPPMSKRIVNNAYVEIVQKPRLTPSSSLTSIHSSPVRLGKQKSEDDASDMGDYEMSSPSKRRSMEYPASARRAGDRDERAPVEKFVSFLEDIFEAEDSLPPEISADELPEFFSGLTADRAHPLLHSNTVRKLIKMIDQVAKPTKRMRQAGAAAVNTPGRVGRMGEVDPQMLSRVLKLLDRTVRTGEDIDPFVQTTSAPAPVQPSIKLSPRKKRPIKKKVDRRSRTPKGEGEEDEKESVISREEEEPNNTAPREATQVDFENLTQTLNGGRDSILAADCCIALLGSDRLTKQLYSEELITSCLSCIKNQLTKLVYPFVEGATELGSVGSNNHPLLRYLIKDTTPQADTHRRQLSEVFQCLSAVLPKINNLVNAETISMSDSIIIQVVFIAIGPFFIVEPGEGDAKGKKDNTVVRTFGKSAMRGLRLDALSLIRSIFANHESQRSWIIEEILSSLIKLSDTKQKAGQFKLRDGRSIRTVSALLLQLVQTSAHDIRIEARSILKARQNKVAMRRQESLYESQAQNQYEEDFLDDVDHNEIRLYLSGLESATKAAKTIILFLTQRSGKGKVTKNSNEAEYRAIFDNFISDLLVVHNWPEWPAATLLLNIASKFMVSSLDDVKSTSQNDTNAAKTMALDHLGVIAAHLRTTSLKVSKQGIEGGYRSLKPLDEVVAACNGKALDKLLAAHREVAVHLAKRSTEDQAYDSARELTAVTLAQELAQSLKQINGKLEDTDDEDSDDKNGQDTNKIRQFGLKLKNALQDIWKDPSADVFDIASQDEASRIDRLAEEIGTIQYLRNSFQPILSVTLSALDAPPIFMRTKALRALGQIVTSDATILSAANVRCAIESHLLDSSPAVRDAAVELIGKYMIDAPEVASDYYQKIAERMADTGLAVRKRVIKLLKSFYAVTDSNPRRIDIATRMVLRMLDEDDSVKDLAVKSVEELWFSNVNPTTSGVNGKSSMRSTPGQAQQDKAALTAKVMIIMGTVANFKDRQSPLEDVLHKIMADKQNSEAASLHGKYSEICELLIDGLVDDPDMAGAGIINTIRTIYLFTAAYPAVLSGSHAKALLTYLKHPTTPEEQVRSDYLLKIFRVTIPYLPKTAAKFGQDLQLTLQAMVVKPFGNSVLVLQEIVACLCTVVHNLTREFMPLINLVKSINVRVQQAIKRPATSEMTNQEILSLTIIIYIVSLIGEYCDFDKLRSTNETLSNDIDAISPGPIVEHIYDILLRLYDKFNNATLRNRILQCLGFLFRAQPTLMTKERSAVIMDAIFASPEQEGRARLLKIMQDFLQSEAAKHSAQEKENAKSQSKPSDVNMDELVGNTDGFADSGVSSAIVQRYLNPILEAALSQIPQIQTAAVDVLSFTIKQGLAHPLQSFPVIVALETSPSTQLSNRASALHSLLHGKHASLLNTRYINSARVSFDYQKKISKGAVQGFRASGPPTALLHRWYSHVREKRPTRQEFLKSLVKVFQDNSSHQSSQDDVDFTRYMAENFSAFEYKTQEEVITVIKHLTSVLSTTGMQLLEIVSPSHLLSQLQGPNEGPANPSQDTSMDTALVTAGPNFTNRLDRIPSMRTSVIISMVMLLKAHLKMLYSLSEEKCNKFVIGKKSAIGDRPATKRHDNPISWSRLPFAAAPILTSEDVDLQRQRFLDIWNEDGVSAEPQDDFV